MGLFRSLKGKHPDYVGGSSSAEQTGASSHRPEAPPTSQSCYGCPAFAPPPEPPPSQIKPPQGPPPTFMGKAVEYAPPPGPPPPKYQEDPPPYHDWTSIPDTSLLPPPPSLGHEFSPTSNASMSVSLRAEQWCERNQLFRPHRPDQEHIATVRSGRISLLRPREYQGSLLSSRPGQWNGKTNAGCMDCSIIGSLPLFFVETDSPFVTEQDKTIYFEVNIQSFGRRRREDESSLAIGFCAVPYPTWRMPGWERGSLAVHADDGRRYVNDPEGGKDFITPIQAGETIGIGMKFSLPDSNNSSHYVPLKAEVLVTRNGMHAGGWNLHEELDASNKLGVFGLDGSFDLYAAIGIFGEVSFKVNFRQEEWLWKPE